MKTSLFAFATDLLGEGIDRVLDNVERRAGAGGLTLATVYHAGRDLFPHNPQRRVRFLEGGVCYFRPDPARYQRLKLQPRVSRLVEDADVLADLVPETERRGLDVHAWTVYLHADRLDEREAA